MKFNAMKTDSPKAYMIKPNISTINRLLLFIHLAIRIEAMKEPIGFEARIIPTTWDVRPKLSARGGKNGAITDTVTEDTALTSSRR